MSSLTWLSSLLGMGRSVDIEKIKRCGRNLGLALRGSMSELFKTNPKLDQIYAVCLVANDEFTSLTWYCNIEAHFQKSKRSMLDSGTSGNGGQRQLTYPGVFCGMG